MKKEDVEMRGLSYPWLNNQVLTLNGPNFEHLRGIICALRSSPSLQRLVINLHVYECERTVHLSDLNTSLENYWNSNGTIINCVVSHLKTVEIIGLAKQDDKLEAKEEETKTSSWKRKKTESVLPDPLLHHILSFLPSTVDAIQTDILSKRWRNQWTHVPVLIFDSGMYYDYSVEEFVRFIDNTLLQHDCSKIKKLHLAYDFDKGSNFCWKIRFATRKHVEELILDCGSHLLYDPYRLPQFLLDNTSLAKLEMVYCYFMGDWKVNWGSLKALKMQGYADRDMVRNILSGSPLIELLELNHIPIDDYVIDSKSLKILILDIGTPIGFDSLIEISCPNLEQLTLMGLQECNASTIENVVSSCLLLRSLEVKECYLSRLVVASKSLRKLVLGNIHQSCAIEISCPNLEEFKCYGLNNVTFKVINFPSLIYATLDFEIPPYVEGCGEHVAKVILKQLQNVKELSIGASFIKGGTTPYAFEENYWNSNRSVINCLLPHLKTVEIIGLSKKDGKCKLVLKFIKFLLKKARLLEKLVLVISKDGGTDFAFKVSQKLSSFPRCSQHAIG
ncbi:putative FBD-associated F-box protein At5g56440 [Euphorbia lathyris]|uniref:putative FBD-associated F-box protein At5g56440 n=1 Tax=Euphorbia lathyris TaxID=212925 RepID=UPI0033133EFE